MKTNTNDKIEAITKQLSEGVKNTFTSENFTKWLDTLSKFYNYSANNCLLILMQCPEASRVAGFQSWKKQFNRNVKKGEKAISILAPIPCKFKKEVENEAGELEEIEVNYMKFRPVPVFDISQTEGEALPDICKELTEAVANKDELIKKLSSFSVPIKFETIENGAKGFYSHLDDTITINKGMSDSQTIKTAFHEVAHSILHNKETGTDKDAKRNTREVEAEAVAYTVANYFGIDTSDYSFEYIASWSTGKEFKELEASLSAIQQTAKTIIEGIEAA